MVPSSRTSNFGRSGSHSLAVFLATLIWCVTVCLMPWMMRGHARRRRVAAADSASVMLWAIAALTLAFAWPARYNTNRGYGVLDGVAAGRRRCFFSTVRVNARVSRRPDRSRLSADWQPAAAHGCDRPVCGSAVLPRLLLPGSFLDPRPSRIVPFRVLVPSPQRDGRVTKNPDGSSCSGHPEEDASQRAAPVARRADGRVRRLGHAGRILRRGRRAHGGAQPRRPVRRQPHGRDRDRRPRRAQGGPAHHHATTLHASRSTRPSTPRSPPPTARSWTMC